MPFTLIQAGSSLQLMKTNGSLTTLTLPTGVTIDSSRVPRFTIFGRYVVVVNSPTRPLTVDADGVVRVLTPIAPRTPATLSAVAGGTLTGTYIVAYTYVVFDAFRQIISESPFSPLSASQSVTTQYLRAASLDLSSDSISAIRLYRTTTGGDGTTLFPWIDIEGNTQTSVQDDLADALLDNVAGPTLGAPALFTNIGEFRERLWAVATTDVDTLRYSESSKMYAWPSTNQIKIPRIGSDDRGITGILARREALAIARQNSLVQITGNSNTDFRVVKLSNEVGVEAPDSIAGFRDAIFFLAKDGVYRWDSEGIRCMSDGKTSNWFTTDTYFNRGRFQYAVGRIDHATSKYQLLLSAVGSSNLDRWVEFDLRESTWWGPHKTDAFTPTWMGSILDSSNLYNPVHGSSTGFIYQEQDTRTDDTSTGIAFDVDGKFHDMQTPDIEKYFGELALISKKQSAGTLTINPYVGGLDAAAGTPILADMTKGRERLRRLGSGRFVKLNLQHSAAGQDVEIFGYELPFHELGRR